MPKYLVGFKLTRRDKTVTSGSVTVTAENWQQAKSVVTDSLQGRYGDAGKLEVAAPIEVAPDYP